MISDSTSIVFPQENPMASCSLSELITDVRYVQLETSDGSVLSNPTNVKYEKGIFYVSDTDERLYCFDKDGHFLRPAYHKGKGHGEVVRMYDFDVDTNYLYLLDGIRSVIVKYDHDGNYIDEMELPFRAIRFSLISDGFIFQLAPFGLGNENEDYQIAVTDEKFMVKRSFIKYHTNECNPVTRTPYFTRAYDTVIFAPVYMRSIFSISDSDNCNMLYYEDFETQYYEPSKNVDGTNEAIEQGLFYSYANPLYDGRYILQVFVTSSEQKGMLIIDCQNNHYSFIHSLTQDIPSAYDFDFLLTKSYSDEIKSFIGFSNYYYPGVHDKEIEEIGKSVPDSVASVLIKAGVSYSDNPLLILYRIKSDIPLTSKL